MVKNNSNAEHIPIETSGHSRTDKEQYNAVHHNKTFTLQGTSHKEALEKLEKQEKTVVALKTINVKGTFK